MTTTAIEADGLRKRYRTTTALDGFHLSMPASQSTALPETPTTSSRTTTSATASGRTRPTY